MNQKLIYTPTTVKEIFMHYLEELPEPVQLAVEFTLANVIIWSAIMGGLKVFGVVKQKFFE